MSAITASQDPMIRDQRWCPRTERVMGQAGSALLTDRLLIRFDIRDPRSPSDG
jgi:hypothetical protein